MDGARLDEQDEYYARGYRVGLSSVADVLERHLLPDVELTPEKVAFIVRTLREQSKETGPADPNDLRVME